MNPLVSVLGERAPTDIPELEAKDLAERKREERNQNPT
jgi:hypothetical protein